MTPIPIAAGERIALNYGYDQVVIVARKVGDGGGEHVTTYGRDKAHCDVAARMGDFFKHKLMGWPAPPVAIAHEAVHLPEKGNASNDRVSVRNCIGVCCETHMGTHAFHRAGRTSWVKSPT